MLPDIRQTKLPLNSEVNMKEHTEAVLLSLDRKYKAHQIHPSADQNPQTKDWTARVLISWEERGKSQYVTLYGSPDQFQSMLEAIKFAVDLGMEWIDSRQR
jgi:hypothetical protein